MTEPSPENGHLRMPNEIVDNLARLRLNGSQWQLLWVLWRRTLCWQSRQGWRNRPHKITLREFCLMTDRNSKQLRRELTALVRRGIVLCTDKQTYSFNLNYSSWAEGKTREKGSQNATAVDEKGSQMATQKLPNGYPTVAKTLPCGSQLATTPDTKSKLLKKRKKHKETKETKTVKNSRSDPTIKRVLDRISEEIGGQIPFYAKEGLAVKRALQMGFTEEQIIGCWQKLKQMPYWRGRWLHLATVTENLGDFVVGRLGHGDPGHNKGKASQARATVHGQEDFSRRQW